MLSYMRDYLDCHVVISTRSRLMELLCAVAVGMAIMAMVK
jgi:hypothetical protein